MMNEDLYSLITKEQAKDCIRIIWSHGIRQITLAIGTGIANF